jgi:shikimate 5-dehydrogenase
MPHKITTLSLMDEVSATARIAGACNAILLRDDGTLLGDMFDGEGFVRGMIRKCRSAVDARALVVGNGGVGSAIALAPNAQQLHDGAEVLACRSQSIKMAFALLSSPRYGSRRPAPS